MAAATRPRFLPVPYQDSAESGRLILRDGTTAHVRPARAEDGDELHAFFTRLSPQSRYNRFFSASVPSPQLVRTLCDCPDPARALTLVVTRTHGGAPRVVATGSYFARDSQSAEVALAVDDAYQGKGLGTLLLERLALLAARHGFTCFWAVTRSDNPAILTVFRDSGFAATERAGPGEVVVELAVRPGEAAVARSELRDRVATTASLLPFFKPRAVAVVGASREPAAVGRRALDALLNNGYRGPVYPVNPNAAVIGGARAYPTVRDLPEVPDLAVVAVPAAAVPAVIDDCAARGVRAVVVLSAGFAEAGDAGRERQRRLVEQVRGHGMRLIGPNCLGLMNTDPAVRLNASFSPV